MKIPLALLFLALPASAQGLPFHGPGDVWLDPGPEGKGELEPPTIGGRQVPSPTRAGAPAGFAARAAEGQARSEPPDWWQWWEFNKLAWSPPYRLGHEGGAERAYQVAEERWPLRRRLLPLLRADSRHPQANVRAAALVALARVQGADAFDDVVARFTDPSPEVRRSAILALGATGSERAVHRLLEIARSGLATEDAAITPRARALAVVALGLARRDGIGRHAVSFLPAWSSVHGAAELENLGFALLLHQSLAPAPEMEPVARELSSLFGSGTRSRLPNALQCRAAEALRCEGTPDPVLLHRLAEEIGRRDLAFRRSIALTLAAIGQPTSLPDVREAFLSEREQTTRGFLVLALGRLGGPDERDFLIRTLAKGDRTLRPWCALALGMLARRADDDVARAAIRDELANECNAEAAGAFLLASGIAEDPQAIAPQGRALAVSPSVHTRLYAAEALTLTRDAGAADVLRRALLREETPLVRIAIAQGLGNTGAAEDVPLLLGVLDEVRRLDHQSQVGTALGVHGTLAMAHGVVARLESGALSPVARGAALQAIGILLAEGEPFALTQACQHANFTIFPDWFYEPILTTL